MANNRIDVTLSFNDKFTKKLAECVKKTAKLGNKLEKQGRKIQKVGKSLSKNITAPVAALGTFAVKAAADFESGMSKVQSICGASGDELQALSEKAKEMGAKTKFSATESTEAFSYMAMAGWKAKDMLDGIEGVMYLAGATGEDLATTSDIVTDSLTAFGLTAKDTDHFVNVLAATATNSNTNVGLMGETFKYVAPLAGALGYSIDDTATAIGIMANSGIKASNAGTSLRALLTNLSKPSKQVSGAMKELGISLTDENGKMKSLGTLVGDLRGKFSGMTEAQKSQYAATLAGKTGMSGLLALVNASEKDFEKLTGAISDSAGAAESMYNTANDNLSGQLTILKSQAESIAISFGEKMMPTVKKVTGFLSKLADKVSNLNGEQVETIIKIAGVAAAVGPCVTVIGKAVSTGGKLVRGIGKLGKAAKGILGFAGKLGPKGLIIIGIIAAIAAVAYLIIKNWDKIKPVVDKVLGAFVRFGKGVAGVVKSIIGFFKAIPENVNKIVNKVKAKINGLQGILGAWRDNIGGIFSGVKQYFKGIYEFISGVFTGNWKKAWTGVKDIFGGVFNSIISYTKIPLNGVIGLLNKAIAHINKIKIDVPDWVPIVGGKSYGGNIPSIPYLYNGTKSFAGGTAVIHDRGAEIVRLPKGAEVIPHRQSLVLAYRRGQESQGGKSVIVNKLADTIVVREEADIDKIAEKLAEKLDGTDVA